MHAQRARITTATGALIWAVAFAWHPILLDPADAAGVAATVARTPNWPWIHLLAAFGLTTWSLGLVGLGSDDGRCRAGAVALGTGLALWLTLLIAEAIAMPPLALATASGAPLLRALVWPLALALGYGAYGLGGIGTALAAPRRPQWMGAWGRVSGWFAAATALMGYSLGPAALWVVGPTALSLVLWSLALPVAADAGRYRDRPSAGRRAG